MSNVGPTEHETGRELSLTEAVEDVSQQGYAQAVALQEKQQMLTSFQAILSGIEKKGDDAELELKSNVRQILLLEGKMEHLQRNMQDLGSHSVTIYNENTELRLQLEEEGDNSRSALAGYNTYRNKMEGHRVSISQAESLTTAHRELEEKRTLVRTLRERREELRADLENPEGNAARQAQKEIDDLRGQISSLRKIVGERRELLLKEFESHTLIKKDIEIQNRRYEAIVKRLHCQLKKAHSSHRQISGDIYHTE